MPRKPRPLDRKGGALRDASLIVIASEDTYAVKQYFARFKTRRVQVIVIPTEDRRSAPRHVMTRLDDFKKEYATEPDDTFWLCIDRDRWGENHLQSVLRDCMTKRYGVALSNPSFELWILLHYQDATEIPSTMSSNDCEERLRRVLGGYSKQCCRTIQLTKDRVENAIQRARSMDGDPNQLLPANPQTRVYKILDALIAKDAIDFS